MDKKTLLKKAGAFMLTVMLMGSISACTDNAENSSSNAASEKSSASSLELDLTAVPFENTDLDAEQFKKTLTAQGNLARLARVLDKAEKGENIVIGTFGGSITEGMSASTKAKCYSTLLTLWFRETFSKTSVDLINGGIGATGSIIGASRIENDLLAKKPDLVIVEFACNDPMDALSKEAYEGVVRKILSQENNPAVILLFMSKETGAGGTSQANQIIVGSKYGLPMISYHDGVQAAIKDGRLKWSDISPDVVHPNDRGHRLAADLIIQRIKAVQKYQEQINRDIPPLPESGTRFANASLKDNKTLLTVSNGAFAAKDGLYMNASLSHGWVATELDKPLVFETKSKVVTLLFKRMVMTRGATAQILVDGVEVARLQSDFKGGFGEYADLKTVIDREDTKKVRVEIKLVSETDIPAGSRFVLLAVLES